MEPLALLQLLGPPFAFLLESGGGRLNGLTSGTSALKDKGNLPKGGALGTLFPPRSCSTSALPVPVEQPARALIDSSQKKTAELAASRMWKVCS